MIRTPNDFRLLRRLFAGNRVNALGEERHFALVGGFALPTLGSLVIVSGLECPSDPCISSIRNCDHDYYFELLFL